MTQLIPIRTAAELIGVPVRVLHAARKAGKLVYYDIGSRSYYTTTADLDAWRESCRVQTQDPALSSGTTAASTSDGTSADGDASVRRAQAIARGLSKRWERSFKPNDPEIQPAPVIPLR